MPTSDRGFVKKMEGAMAPHQLQAGCHCFRDRAAPCSVQLEGDIPRADSPACLAYSVVRAILQKVITSAGNGNDKARDASLMLDSKNSGGDKNTKNGDAKFAGSLR